MPRSARKRSEWGVYHVIVQGKWRERIFEKTSEKSYYIQLLRKKRENGECCLFGYCILDNSAHLVIGEKKSDISMIMRALGNSYAFWFRRQHEVEGTVFYDRYRSEPIEGLKELMRVCRFVHQLPVRYGLSEHCSDYPWSSYRLYTEGKTESLESELLFEQIGPENFERYTYSCWKDIYLEENRKYGIRREK